MPFNNLTLAEIGVGRPLTTGMLNKVRDGLNYLNRHTVKVATTENINLTGLKTVDGLSLIEGDRVLVKDQIVKQQNGLYVVSTDSWLRAIDTDSPSLINGLFVSVNSGLVNGGSCFLCLYEGNIAAESNLGIEEIIVTRVITNGDMITKKNSRYYYGQI